MVPKGTKSCRTQGDLRSSCPKELRPLRADGGPMMAVAKPEKAGFRLGWIDLRNNRPERVDSRCERVDLRCERADCLGGLICGLRWQI